MLKVEVKTEHFAAASEYNEPQDCPLYHATKALFPEDGVSVGPYIVRVKDKETWITKTTFSISNNWTKEISTNYINNSIENAKKGKEIPTIVVTLEELSF